MAMDDEMKGSNSGGPYVQFEKCTVDPECRYKDVWTGKCSYETCIITTEHPPTVDVWTVKCVMCDEEYTVQPNQMKIRMCPSCQARAHAAEVLPFSCVFCGSSQDHPSKIFLSGICDSCFAGIRKAIFCRRCV